MSKRKYDEITDSSTSLPPVNNKCARTLPTPEVTTPKRKLPIGNFFHSPERGYAKKADDEINDIAGDVKLRNPPPLHTRANNRL